MLSLIRWLSRRGLPTLHALGAALGWLAWLASPTYRRQLQAHLAQAGFGAAEPAAAASTYTGSWIAENAESKQTVATIQVDANNKVTVDGKPVTGKLSDGGLVFKVGFITEPPAGAGARL